MALIREDFPTFGRPTNASFGASCKTVASSCAWKKTFDRFDELGYAPAMLRADSERPGETEASKV